jgi:hypothetical protein
VRIVWRGGRPFKQQQDISSARKRANGNGNAVISLDSDEEGEHTKAFEDKPEFEDEKEELDPSNPYPAILQTLDLVFGTDVLHLATLPAPVLKADGPSWRVLEPLKQKLVFAAACADNSIRLVTLPLTPPSPESKARPEFRTSFTAANAGNGKWGETVVVLSRHQKPSDGVSMTVDFSGNSKELVAAESKSSLSEPRIVVASHSREVTGLLLFWRIPIKSPQSHTEPFQSIYLPSAAKSISFNPALARNYSSHLLVADSTGVCRIYDYKLLIKNTEEPSENPAAEQGTWLLSLYAGFQSAKNDSPHVGTHAGFGRKAIVDAQWVSAGKAVIVLLNDGEWAIWDIEGAGPGASQGLLGRQSIKGGSRSEYSLTGYIDAAVKSRAPGPPQLTASKFAPMTPGTRKTTTPFNNGPSGPVHGQISVIDVPSSSPTNPSDESVVFWFGETFHIIPNLSKYWAAHSHKSSGQGNLFTGPTGARMIKIENVDLRGERCSGIAQITKGTSSTGFPSDILILGEHRLTILSAGKAREQQAEKVRVGRMALVEKNVNDGELDVVGIEQALMRMENGNGAKRKLF